MSFAEAAIAVAIGLGSGILAGVFGVGGGIVMTPGLQVFLGVPAIVALATPLPVLRILISCIATSFSCLPR